MSNEIAKRRNRTIEMTQGSLWKNMFFFSVPLMFSQILEVMFNLSDVAVDILQITKHLVLSARQLHLSHCSRDF